MAFIYPGCLIPALDGNGDPLSGAKMHVYLAETATPTTTWTSDEGSTPNSNPIISDSAGRWPPVFLHPDVPVRVKVTDSSGSYTVYDVDHVAPGVGDDVALYSVLAGNGGAGLVGTSTGETVEDRLERTASGIGLFETFAVTPPSIGGAIKTVHTDGWSVQGIGAARYIYDAAVNSGYVGSYPRTSFLAADGRGFRLDLEQEIHLEMAGGRCDCPGSLFVYDYTNSGPALSGTDNLPALNELMKLGEGWINGNNRYTAPVIHCYGGTGQFMYYFSGPIVPPRAVHIKGRSNGMDLQGGTFFKFPANTGGIVLHLAQTNPSGRNAAGSIIEGIYFHGNGGTSRTAHGAWVRCQAILRDCVFDGFSGNNLNAVGSIGFAANDPRFGQTSSSLFERCTFRYAGNWNIYVEGSDASQMTFLACDVRLSRLGGIWENSGFGNAYVGCGIHDYGNGRVGAVHHGGRLYVLIDPTPGIGSSTTPGTNNLIWYDLGAGSASTSWPAWSSSNSYEISLPAMTGKDQFSNGSAFVGCYLETFYPCHFAYGAQVFGGTMFKTRYSRGITSGPITGAMYNPSGFGAYKGFSPSHASYGTYFEASVGGTEGVILNHRQQSDGEIDGQLKYSGKDVVYMWGANRHTFLLTGPGTSKTFGTSATKPGYMEIQGLALGDPNNGNNTRLHATGTAAPTSGAHARGEVVWNVNASAGGTLAWVCTVSGTPGTWTALTLS